MRARLVCRELWRSCPGVAAAKCGLQLNAWQGGQRAMGLGRLERSVAMRLPAEAVLNVQKRSSGLAGARENACMLRSMHVTDGDCPMSSIDLAFWLL